MVSWTSSISAGRILVALFHAHYFSYLPPTGRNMALLQSINLTARVLCSEIEVPLLGEMFNEWCVCARCYVLLFSFLLFETLWFFLQFGLLHLTIPSSPVVHVNFIKGLCDFQLCPFELLIMAHDSTIMGCHFPQKDCCKGWYISPEGVLSLPEVVFLEFIHPI